MKEFNDFMNALYAAGFEESTTTIRNVFDEDEYPEHEELGYGEVDDVFNMIAEKHDYELMECKSGGAGSGEYCYGIIRLGNKYFKAEWSYYSYNGEDYDDIENTIKEVTLVQKTITVYE